MRLIERGLALALVLAVVLNICNVVGRYGLGVTIAWADEVQVFAMIGIAFLGAAVATARNTHLRMDAIVSWLPRSAQSWIAVIESVALAALLSFTGWWSFQYVERVYLLEQKSEMSGLPMWLPHAAVAAGFVLMAAIAARRSIGLFAEARRRASDGGEP